MNFVHVLVETPFRPKARYAMLTFVGPHFYIMNLAHMGIQVSFLTERESALLALECANVLVHHANMFIQIRLFAKCTMAISASATTEIIRDHRISRTTHSREQEKEEIMSVLIRKEQQ